MGIKGHLKQLLLAAMATGALLAGLIVAAPSNRRRSGNADHGHLG